MCAKVQIIPQEGGWRQLGVWGQKTKHVPDELVKHLSWKMTSLQSEGRVPMQDLRIFDELSCSHSALSVPYYWEDQ